MSATWNEDEPLLPGVPAESGMFDEPEGYTALRAQLLNQTTHVVRGFERRKRFTRIAGWGLAYAAGILSAWLALRNVAEEAPQAPAVARKEEPTRSTEPPKVVNPKRSTPEMLRARVAGARRDVQIELLRQAGDMYLNERNDLRSAVQCYQQVLELADTPEQLAVLPDDSWLMAELKSSQRVQ